MARYTDTQEIAFNALRDSRNITNTGTLTVSVWTGVEWDVADTLSPGSREYFTKGLRLKFEVSTAGYYYIEEGGNE